jgi:hypothetical protein
MCIFKPYFHNQYSSLYSLKCKYLARSFTYASSTIIEINKEITFKHESMSLIFTIYEVAHVYFIDIIQEVAYIVVSIPKKPWLDMQDIIIKPIAIQMWCITYQVLVYAHKHP